MSVNKDRQARRFQNLRERGMAASDSQGMLSLLKKLFLLLFTVISIAIAFIGFKVGIHLMKVPNLSFLHKYNPVQTIQIYDRNDKLVVAVEGSEKRVMIPLNKVSNNMIKALLAAEDHRFYEHQGFSMSGIGRALYSNISHGKVVEGGSTITQQLAKNLFFEGEKRSFDLKLAELVIAISLEKQFSKNKLLELYLNEVYFGNNSYGIEQASRTYFSKHASDLSLAEAAFLSGIIRYPRGGQPQYRQNAVKRQQEVLAKMQLYGFISEAEKNLAMSDWLEFKSFSPQSEKIKIARYPYYVSTVIESLHGRYDAASIEKQGLKIYTNLDTIAQEAAERALSQGLARAPYGVNQGALVTIRVSDGAVLALVGGVGDYAANQWNCATNPHTAGSAFKPFVYLAAFEKGMIQEYDTVDDSPFAITDQAGKEYRPKNYDGKFLGGITVAKAFAYSRNIPALRIGQAVGIDSVINVAERAGISEALAPELSLALGCSAVSPLHMANAYATIARGGIFMTPSLVRRVETRAGRRLESFSQESSRVFDHQAVSQLVDLMQDCVAEGTGQLAKLADRPVAGKTGTADHGKDLWFVGFTPDLVTAVWGGNKDNKAVGGSVSGGTLMARIWRDYSQDYYKKVPTPAGCFIASNRAPASLGSDIPLMTSEEEKRKALSQTSAAPASISSSTSTYRTYSQSKRPHGQSRRRTYDHRRAPAGGAIVKQNRGITEYSWSRR